MLLFTDQMNILNDWLSTLLYYELSLIEVLAGHAWMALLHINASWFILFCFVILEYILKKIRIVTKNKNSNYLNKLTTFPIYWATAEIPVIYWSATSHNTIRIMYSNITFDFLTIGIIYQCCIIEICIANTGKTTDSVRVHFLSLYVFFMIQIAFHMGKLLDFLSIWKLPSSFSFLFENNWFIILLHSYFPQHRSNRLW